MNVMFAPSDRAAGAAAPQPDHCEFLGLRFSSLPLAETVRLVIDHCGAPYRYAVTPNAYDVVSAHEAPEGLLPIYRGAWLSVCDSRIVRALARLDRHSLPLVPGSDLVAALLAELDRPERRSAAIRILIVGPPPDIAAALRARFPHVSFDILPAPAGLADHPERRLAVARACLDRPWNIALLCVGAPAQGLIARQLAELGRPSGVALCVGASIDFLTGARRRAPLWLQRLSLEWAYRLVREPRRLWRRYLVESPKIGRIFLEAWFERRRRGGAGPTPQRDTPA